MFEGFTRQQIKTQAATLNLVRGGNGDPVLLLHGYPQTHACWHRVAPLLAEKFRVVCADLRGCGDSAKPESDAEHLAYSKRVMAQDQVEAMRQLGFDEFAVVGHDRGARVAHRMALDYSEKITKLALLDIIPTDTAFAKTDKEIATAAWNWFFSIQDDGLPERLIGAEPKFYPRWLLDHWAGEKNALDEKAVAEYERCFDAETIRATCEEFRAAASVDLVHDAADKERKIACPTLALWSATGMWAKYDILEIWRERAESVRGRALDGGHFLPEENSEETAATINSSFRLYYDATNAGAIVWIGETIKKWVGSSDVPTGFASFPKDINPPPRAWAERFFNIERWTEMPRGGHFAAMEEPELLAEDVRDFFQFALAAR